MNSSKEKKKRKKSKKKAPKEKRTALPPQIRKNPTSILILMTKYERQPKKRSISSTIDKEIKRSFSIKIRLSDIEHLLQVNNQLPVLFAHIISEMCLQRIDRLSRDKRVKCILLLQVTPVRRLVGTFDLNGHRRLTLLDDRNGFVIKLNRCSIYVVSITVFRDIVGSRQHTPSPN